MLIQHHHNAYKADTNSAPAIGPHALFQNPGGQSHTNQRCCKANRHGVCQRQKRQRGKAEKHPARADKPAQQMPEWPLCGNSAGKFSAPMQPRNQHQQSRPRAKKHDFAGRKCRRFGPAQRIHQGEQQGREYFQANSAKQSVFYPANSTAKSFIARLSHQRNMKLLFKI